MGRDEKRAPLKTPAWETRTHDDEFCFLCFKERKFIFLFRFTWPLKSWLLTLDYNDNVNDNIL